MASYNLKLILGQACAFFLINIYLIVVYFNYHKKMKQLFMTILRFSNIDIQKSIEYWKKVIDVFQRVDIAYKNERE